MTAAGPGAARNHAPGVAMQDDSGLKRLLSVAWVYELVQTVLGANHARRWLARTHWRLRGGERVVDVGCGPGHVRDFLPPDIDYVGFDLSAAYIASAGRAYAGRGVFLVGTAATFLDRPDPRMAGADLVLCTGLLHHLGDDESAQILRLAAAVLRPGGRLVCFEPTFLAHQTRLSRWWVRRDRGRNVRTEAEWKALVGKVFADFSSSVNTGLMRIPYVHIVLECRKPAAGPSLPAKE